MSNVTISAKEVAELRARTSAGIADCKNALVEAEGDMNRAVEILRTKGIAKAEKRAGRVASEGRIACLTSEDGHAGILLELNSETDFVSRGDEFGALTDALGAQLLNDANIDGVFPNAGEGTFPGAPAAGAPGKTVGELVTEASAKTGEKVVLRRYARFQTAGALGTYLHHNGKVATLVEVTGSDSGTARTVARQIAEHVAAGVPSVALAVTRADVPAEAVDRERRIFEEQAKQSGKPENIVQKMVEGRVNKFFAEVALVEQPWVRDEAKSIKQLLDDASRELGGNVTLAVRRFVRYRMGEE
ncbi:MAG: Elongation factor Ts [Gemmatimonadaceae bacterium]|nr:Elongation factor Ts [Gemmatimonadaceae bacterium]